MSVLVFLPERLFSHIRYALAAERDVIAAHSWSEVEEVIRRESITALIVDPAASGVMNVEEVGRLMTRYPSMPLIVYVPLNPASFMAVSHLSRHGLDHVVLHRLDDSADQFRETLERARSNPLTRELLDRLAPRLEKLPVQLVRAVTDLFEKPQRYTSALDLALGGGVANVRLYRSFESADLASPKKMVTAAKLIRGYSYLGDPGYTVREIALKLGYRHPRIFTEHAVEVFGMTPSRVRHHLTPSEAVARVLRWLGVGSPVKQKAHTGVH